MMIIEFINEYGSVAIKGNGKSPIRLISVDGLEFVSKYYNLVKYAGENGIENVYSSDNQRVITLSGDITVSGAGQLEKLSLAFAKSGTLIVTNGTKRRKTGYRPTSFELKKQSRKIYGFVAQIECDNPYFQSVTQKKESVFKRIDLVKGTVTLPCIFTARQNECKIINPGHTKVEPIIRLYYVCDTTTSSENNGISINNTTTNQKIELKTDVKTYEEITVDIPERKITAKNGTSLLTKMSDDTFLSDFWLNTGVNIITVTNNNTLEQITAQILFSPQYYEVM